MNQKKKIAWVTPEYFLDTDVYIIEQLCTDFEINWYIITVNDKESDYAEKINNISKKGTKVSYLKIHQKGMHPGNIILFNNLMSKIKKNNDRMLYTSLSYPAYYLPIVKIRIGKKKVVLAIHNVHVPHGGIHYFRNRCYNKFAFHFFENYQTFSMSQYRELRRRIHDKNILYAPFILKDFGVSKQSKPDSGVNFLSFGNIRDYKCIDVLIEAAQEVYEETKSDFRVIIAGNCDNWAKYQVLIREPSIFKLIIRRIDNREIPDLFAECDYFVTPYKDIAQSGSAIIAVNYGKPIISSRLPAFEEYIRDGETGFFIKPADKDELKSVMIRVIENHKNNYAKLVQNIERFREEEFSSDIIIDKYKEFINNVIGN